MTSTVAVRRSPRGSPRSTGVASTVFAMRHKGHPGRSSRASAAVQSRAARPLVVVAAVCAVAGATVVPAVMASAARAEIFEWDGVVATGVNPGMIATDGAGRVYVPDPTGGRVLVYAPARDGNRFLRSFGEGRLQRPYAVAINNREGIAVADRGANAIVVFDRYGIGLAYAGSAGSGGTAIGQLDAPAQIVNDLEPRLFVAETGNRRVQVFDQGATRVEELYGFGVNDPEPFVAPTGIGLDGAGRVYVSSMASGGEVRVFDPRGLLLAGAVPAAEVNAPAGIFVDGVNRLLVADSGNGRILLRAPFDQGSGQLSAFGTPGAGDGQFVSPLGLALAPGAMLYVSDPGAGRVVRLRFDDADRDGAIDALDVCPGLADPAQLDHDHDRIGDVCDLDDDNDGVVDSLDTCPLTPIAANGKDADGDGCDDPVSRVVSPRRSAVFTRRGPTAVRGVAYADTVGVAAVSVAVARRAGGRCAWWTPRKRRFVRGSCSTPRFARAAGTRRWGLALPRRAVRPGRYFALSRAVQARTGVAEPVSVARARVDFRRKR